MRVAWVVFAALLVSVVVAQERFTFTTESSDLKGIVADILLQSGQEITTQTGVMDNKDKDDGGDKDAQDVLEKEEEAPPNFFKTDLTNMSPDMVVKSLGSELKLMSSTLFGKVRDVTRNVQIFTKKSKALYSTVQDMKKELKNVKGNLGSLEGDREKMSNTLQGAVGGLEGQLAKANSKGKALQGKLKADSSIKGALSRLSGNMKALYGKVDHLKRAIARVRREAEKIKKAAQAGCGGGGGGPSAKPKMSCSCRAAKDPGPSMMEMNEMDPSKLDQYFGSAAGAKLTGDDPVARLAAETDPVTLLQEDAEAGDPDKKVCYCDDGIDALLELELEFEEE